MVTSSVQFLVMIALYLFSNKQVISFGTSRVHRDRNQLIHNVVSFGRYKSVTVDHDSILPNTNWIKSWPDVIRLSSRFFF